MKENRAKSLIPQTLEGVLPQKFHSLPGQWAKEQLSGTNLQVQSSSSQDRSTSSSELQKALDAENSRHNYWEKWQGVTPGKPEYVNPIKSAGQY